MQISTPHAHADDEPTDRTPVSLHFVEITVAAICVVAISVSVARHVFGIAAMLGTIGLVLVARSFFGRRV